MQSKRVFKFSFRTWEKSLQHFLLNAFDATVHFRAAFLLEVGESEFWRSPSQVKLMASAPKRCSSQEFGSIFHSESEWRQKGQRVLSCLKVYTMVWTNFLCTFGRINCGSTLQICKCTRCICMKTASAIKNEWETLFSSEQIQKAFVDPLSIFAHSCSECWVHFGRLPHFLYLCPLSRPF